MRVFGPGIRCGHWGLCALLGSIDAALAQVQPVPLPDAALEALSRAAGVERAHQKAGARHNLHEVFL